jgi:poly(hydroxyalkanoate) depolymerase family esterase
VTAVALLAVAAVTVMLGVDTAGAQSSAGRLVTRSYSNAAGTRAYEVYVPGNYRAGTAAPLIVALHGCTETADQFRQLSRYDEVADSSGAIVVYPEQTKDANYMSCWNWFQDAHNHRGSGEPSLIAGITNAVRHQYNINAHHIYVTGLSAGGAMASVMGATYPDLYAAVGVGSGCEYGAGAACAGYQSTDPTQAAQKIHQEMGSRARVMPFIIFQGDQDKTVPPVNADQMVRADLLADDMADDGARNGSISQWPSKTSLGQGSGGRSYTVRHYADRKGRPIGEYWTIHGMAHAWSGGPASIPFSDSAGPNESAAMYSFFSKQFAP